MYKHHSNPMHAPLSIIRIYLVRQAVGQVANSPSNLAIKDISFALSFPGSVFSYGQPATPDQSNRKLEPRPLCCVLGKGDPGRSPGRGFCRAKRCWGQLHPLHVICGPRDSGRGIKETGRNFILERATEST